MSRLLLPVLPVLLASLLSGCSPCTFDSGIVRGTVDDAATGMEVEGGTVQLIPITGETTEVSIFGTGLYEASVEAGTYEVVAYDDTGNCFSAIADVEVAPCDELVVNLTIIDCF